MDKFLSIIFILIFASNYINMERLEKMEEPKIKVKVSELIKKFKSRQDIFDYCREQSIILFLFFRLLFPKRTGI